ncbi:DNA replication/repair protein RecF [Nesterenkonia natronophila]|uniref:DNA replication and repair protein RecF n=1 Tax=Nesterenkonia natronophila TaxID=2174932 RepID=A0A3A4F2X2_9MICC|nr:DNA replication/repair protein RecF [Nesterenkonia natronophila]RJN32403.1 DNA replication/repair protein RecF [Nesterenkonia natronophila]
MRLSQLVLQNFRSYAETELTLQPGPNVLLGYNGVGKTNIAEAVGYLASLSSHRVTHDAPLIRHGQSQAIIRAQAHRGRREALVEVEINPGKSNRARINRGSPVRASQALGILRTVLFAPEDLELLKGSPGVRRRLLDTLAVQLHPALGQLSQEYGKVLRQRNALLKSIRHQGFTPTHESTLEVWDTQLAQVGGRLLRARLDVLGALRPHLSQAYQDLSHSVRTARIRYLSSLTGHDADSEEPADAQSADSERDFSPLEEATTEELIDQLHTALHSVRRRERERGITLIGPHRDDVYFSLDSTPVKGYASQGETWSFALGLRLASYRVMIDDDPEPGAEPILILDDVFAELDARRRRRLADLATGAEQLIVTAAVDDDVPHNLLSNAYRVESVNQVSRTIPTEPGQWCDE